MRKQDLPYYFLVIVLFLVDQLTKFWIQQKIPLYGHLEVIPGFFNLTHIHNRGAIFGFFAHTSNPVVQIGLAVASFLALGFVIFYFIRTPASERILRISLSLILAGALGNLTDRLLRGYVVDFLDFYVGRWHWPNFNLADSCITVGAIILIFTFFISEKEPA
ncbi:signal peptidase II [Candidatus Aminicenantes bacterium AC-334-K16]|jgi:signal peptidase II|nr:signal peptidase II [Candidatus Aminicenantes bacterium AC-334-K16]